jgi:hypothetical protein
MNRNRRGYTILEIVLASVLLLYVSLAFYSLHAATAKQGVHSQFLSLADMTCDSLLEEVEAHRFGMPAPADWGLQGPGPGEWQTLEYDIWLAGKKVQTIFHTQWHLQNGSFTGHSFESQDLVTIVVSWREGQGEDRPYGEFSEIYFPGDNRHLVVQVPVWR